MKDELMDSSNRELFPTDIVGKTNLQERTDETSQDLTFLHTIGGYAPDPFWLVFSPIVLFIFEAVVISTVVLVMQSRRGTERRKKIFVRWCPPTTSSAQTDAMKLDKYWKKKTLQHTRYLKMIYKVFPPIGPGKRHNLHPSLSNKQEERTNELKSRREHIQTELASSLQDELSVAEITLNETERRVDNLRKELTALNYKTNERKDELLEFKCWWELSQSKFSETKSEVAVMRRLLQTSS